MATFVLPLYPLESRVLLPGESVQVPLASTWARAIILQSRDYGDSVVVSLVDGESVHEIGVTAVVAEQAGDSAALRGVSRCRLLTLVREDLPLVRAERFPEPPTGGRAVPLARLLRARYLRLCGTLSRPPGLDHDQKDLSSLTWRVTATLGLTPDQQQGFLNVPDPMTRGQLLLLAVRELERRERFLRPWAHMRSNMAWN
ncbi:MAG: LON peptidase substrate-binding domain-containing protein [Acidobacteria bacterium]|nr:LON peptidase substrate-binding domain-containing protein [Acidobacteriota bacterium]